MDRITWFPHRIAARDLRILEDVPGVQVTSSGDEAVVTVPLNAAQAKVVRGIAYRYGLPLPHRPDHYHEPLLEGLYPHQQEAALRALKWGGLLLADDMGLGKTRTAIAVGLATEGRKIIVAPSFTRASWLAELRRCGIERVNVLRSRNLDHPSYDPTCEWTWVHYEILDAWQPLLSLRGGGRGRLGILIVDEAHWIKSTRAKRTQSIFALGATARRRLLLTGTPIPNRPRELYPLVTLLDGPGSWGSLHAFRVRYCGAYRDTYGWVDEGPTHTEELRERLGERYLRRTGADIGTELPSLQLRVLECSLPKAAAAHQERRPLKRILEALLAHRAGRDTLALIADLRSRTSRFKAKAVVEHLHHLHREAEVSHSVVFVHERATTTLLATSLRSAGVRAFRVAGDLTTGAREDEITLWRDRGGVLVATYGTLREGVTLTEATHCVIYDLDWVPATMLQAQKRIHRIGQRRQCHVWYAVAANSVDTILAANLLLKAGVIDGTLAITDARVLLDQLDLERYAPHTDMEAWAEELVREEKT